MLRRLANISLIRATASATIDERRQSPRTFLAVFRVLGADSQTPHGLVQGDA